MAEIKPFRGVRFDTDKAGDMQELICPPYDIISASQREEFIEKNPHNIVRLELPAAEDDSDNPYETASRRLNEWIAEGIMVREEKPSLYIYEEQYTLHDETRSIRGILGLVKLEEFSSGVILPHEKTLSKPKDDRLNLLRATNTNMSTIYSLYSDNGRRTSLKMDTLTGHAPDVEVSEGKIVHRLWVVSDETEISAICRDFEKRTLYIADGHHRYETSLNYRNECRAKGAPEGSACDYTMMLLVNMDDQQFSLFPTHRLIKNAPNFDVKSIIAALDKNFRVDEHRGISGIKPTLNEYYNMGRKATVWYVGNDTWYLLKLRSTSEAMDEVMPTCSDALKTLDISIIHALVLDEIMHCNNEDCVNYTRSFTQAINSVDSGEYQSCFILNPTRITQIKDIVEAGEKMPQKSTYIYPKPTTGLVINVFED